MGRKKKARKASAEIRLLRALKEALHILDEEGAPIQIVGGTWDQISQAAWGIQESIRELESVRFEYAVNTLRGLSEHYIVQSNRRHFAPLQDEKNVLKEAQALLKSQKS